MTKLEEIIGLTANQKPRAAAMMARSFMTYPVYELLFPDEIDREQSLSRLFSAVIGYSLVYGLVHTTPPVEGAACWLSPGNTRVTFWRMLRTGLGLQRAVARLKAQPRREFLEAMAFMDEFHKSAVPGPHWYLWALGVEPACQGQGIGGRLLEPVLARADSDGLPCYLETHAERNLPFYRRWGFEVVNDDVMPGRGGRMWTMLRQAR